MDMKKFTLYQRFLVSTLWIAEMRDRNVSHWIERPDL